LETEKNIGFDLQVQIIKWVHSLPSTTESDVEELKAHLWSLIDELKKAGLDDEEAFLVASGRMGSLSELDTMYRDANSSIFQMRKSLIILGGVLFYYLVYYFLLFSSKLLLIFLLFYTNDGQVALLWFVRYFEGAHFLFIFLVITLCFFEKKAQSLVECVNMKPLHAVLLLIVAILLAIGNTCLLPVTRNIMRQNFTIDSQVYDVNFYFRFSFPFLICCGFVVLFFKYYKKIKS
jgi:hypothetical protein